MTLTAGRALLRPGRRRRHGRRHLRLRPGDRPLHPQSRQAYAIARDHATRDSLPGVRLGAELAAGARVPGRPTFFNYFYLSSAVALVQAEVRRITGAVGRPAAAGDEPDRHGRGADLRRRGERRLPARAIPTIRCSSPSTPCSRSTAWPSASSSAWPGCFANRNDHLGVTHMNSFRYALTAFTAATFLATAGASVAGAGPGRRCSRRRRRGARRRSVGTSSRVCPTPRRPSAPRGGRRQSPAAMGRRARRHAVRARLLSSLKSGPGNIYADDPAAMSEDCLSLNVWTPAKAARRPVIVWIHGGALVGRRQQRGCLRRIEARGAGPRGGLDQLPPRRPRLSGPPRPERRVAARHLRQLRPARPDRGAALGQGATSRRSAATPPR